MNDSARRFLLEDLDIRGSILRLGAVWQKLLAGRNYPAPVIDALGQMVAITGLLADNLKQPGRLTAQLHGSGPISRLVVDCDCNRQMNLRCMAHHAERITAAPVSKLFGHGQLLLSLETHDRREPYQSIVPLEGETVAEIFEHYLQASEQVESRFFLAASPLGVAGMHLQKMPAADQRDADGWTRATALAATVKPEELLGLNGKKLLRRLFHEETLSLFDLRPLTHDFPPDPDKVRIMLLALGREDVYANLGRHGVIVVRDELSNHEYRFAKRDIDEMFARTPETPKSVH
ncbi:MAG: Hsp33 family molecular chaperone HslO [Candidatus Accumulibacter sp.]|jgi:molecular chaperone Hsp33|nr:Hsp33 family molecular chaperone HslO [Accumulibacter sp.]